MLKYFRKNRRKFIANDGSTGRTQSNRVSKYLLYAIGEIALVMIGILLALQVNNWNEKKKSNQRQTIYLTQIQQEMNSNLVSLKSNQDKLLLRFLIKIWKKLRR